METQLDKSSNDSDIAASEIRHDKFSEASSTIFHFHLYKIRKQNQKSVVLARLAAEVNKALMVAHVVVRACIGYPDMR